MHDFWIIAAFLITGCIIGIMGGVFGIGGGLIVIPALGLFYGMTQQLSQGTAMIMVISNLLIGMYNYHRNKKLDFRAGLLIGLSSIPTGLFFSTYATHLSSASLRQLFSAFLLLLAAETARKAYFKNAKSSVADTLVSTIPSHWAVLLGLASGCLGGLFGIGGGLFSVVVLAMFFGYPQVFAQGVSLMSVLPGALINLYIYNAAKDINWEVGLLLAAGGSITVPLGVKIAIVLKEKVLKLCFAGLSVVSSILLYIHR